MGKMPRGEFRELVTVLMCSQLSAMMDTLEKCLVEDGTGAAEWAADMGQHLEKMRELMESPGRLIPADVVPRPGQDAVEAVQSFLALYGSLLMWWPAIVERTVELRNAGVAPGVRLGPAARGV